MKRRTPRASSLATPHTDRRKPQWNAYLTDDSRYKLNQQQQLQRQLQQLSTAHFAARSPSASASASRRRLETASAHSSAWSTPQEPQKSRSRSLSDVQDTGELRTARRLQFADVDESMEQEEATPRKRHAVSFQEDRRMDPQQKANLQSELEVLERMLWELETETDRVSWQTPQKTKMHKSPRVREQQVEVVEKESEEYEQEQVQEEEEEDEVDVEIVGEDAETRLGDVCYKSLEIGLDLARKMETLTKELDNERRLREDRDLKIEMLEQEVRSTQARCNYLEAKYQSVATQVDGMREAVVATEEAIHRMTLAFEYSHRRRGMASNPTTPSKPAISRSHHSNDTVKVSKKASTPKKAATPKKPAEQENWVPNKQQH